MPRKAADIRVKRIYDPAAPGDGMRILVDGVWPRGVTKEAAALGLWLKEIAPSAGLRKWFGHDPARWPEFCRRYRVELEKNDAAVERLLDVLGSGRAVLLYAARDTEHNNALALAEHIRDRVEGRHARKSP